MAITLLRPKEVAEQLQCSLRMVYTLLERGDLKGVRFGKSVRIDQASLHDLLEAGRIDATS
jgi:excisionase family DNA binding protein